MVATEGELAVVGDANKTQINTHDFEITFRIPKEKEGGGYEYVLTAKKFKDVYITPRQDTKVVRALTLLIPYYRSVTEEYGTDVKIEDLTDEQKLEVATNMSDELYDAMYDVVGSVLKIDGELREYMIPASVLNATVQIILAFKEVANETDSFFEHSSTK